MKELANMPAVFSIRDLKKTKNKDLPIQQIIENFMQEVIKQGNFETAYLFSQEGLPIAQQYSDHSTRMRTVEISVMMNKVQKFMKDLGKLSRIKEIVVEDEDKKRIVFRFLPFFDQTAILIIVVPPRKAYRGFTNRLAKLIVALGKNNNRTV